MQDRLKEVLLEWFANGGGTYAHFHDLWGDGTQCVIDGEFNLDELASVLSLVAARPISDEEVRTK